MCFVCIFAAFLCAFEGIFMCIWGRFRVYLWLLCVHFSQFCDLMGIQILHNIRL